MSLYHSIPFSMISLSRVCHETKGVKTEMKVRGGGTISGRPSGEDAETFVLLETTLCQDPSDLHAVRVPKGMVSGETVTIYRDEFSGDYFVQIDFDESKDVSIPIPLDNGAALVCKKSLVYKKVLVHFELVKVDGEMVDRNEAVSSLREE